LSGASLLLAAALGASGPAAETPIVAVAARPDGQTVEPRRLGTHYLRLDETVELAAVVVSADDRRAPPPDTEARLRWFEARPEARDYDNVRRCRGKPRADCADPIAYRVVEIARWRGRARISVRAADVGLGTHRYAVTVGAAPAAAAGAVASWAAIVVRRDDTYAGYLTELVGTPFVFWPTAREVDERLGADCVALVIYGRRRLGRRVPYVSPRGLAKLTARVAAGRSPAILPGDRQRRFRSRSATSCTSDFRPRWSSRIARPAAC